MGRLRKHDAEEWAGLETMIPDSFSILFEYSPGSFGWKGGQEDQKKTVRSGGGRGLGGGYESSTGLIGS